MEHEHHAHHHPHGTGTRWLDVTLAVAATIVSLVSLGLAIHSGHAMEKLVAANSYPYLQSDRSNMSNMPLPGTDRNRAKIEFGFTNNGVGPARIEWVQLVFKKKPMANIRALFDACCAGLEAGASTLDMRGNIDGDLVRPGTSLSLFTWTEPDKPNPLFKAVYQQMDDIETSYCYCSVFDECYVMDFAARRPTPVKQCEAPAVTFHPNFAKS